MDNKVLKRIKKIAHEGGTFHVNKVIDNQEDLEKLIEEMKKIASVQLPNVIFVELDYDKYDDFEVGDVIEHNYNHIKGKIIRKYKKADVTMFDVELIKDDTYLEFIQESSNQVYMTGEAIIEEFGQLTTHIQWLDVITIDDVKIKCDWRVIERGNKRK